MYSSQAELEPSGFFSSPDVIQIGMKHSAQSFIYQKRPTKWHQFLLIRGTKYKVLGQNLRLMYQNWSERHLAVFCIDHTIKACYDLVPIAWKSHFCLRNCLEVELLV